MLPAMTPPPGLSEEGALHRARTLLTTRATSLDTFEDALVDLFSSSSLTYQQIADFLSYDAVAFARPTLLPCLLRLGAGATPLLAALGSPPPPCTPYEDLDHARAACAALLVKAGADVNAPQPRTLNTPLHLASSVRPHSQPLSPLSLPLPSSLALTRPPPAPKRSWA